MSSYMNEKLKSLPKMLSYHLAASQFFHTIVCNLSTHTDISQFTKGTKPYTDFNTLSHSLMNLLTLQKAN